MRLERTPICRSCSFCRRGQEQSCQRISGTFDLKESAAAWSRSEVTRMGNVITIITETSEVVFKNGTVREISEHWFQIDSADTEEINVTNIDDDLTSFGNMHSLSYALENDTSGELQELVDFFMNSDCR